jgi:hypothetical protein
MFLKKTFQKMFVLFKKTFQECLMSYQSMNRQLKNVSKMFLAEPEHEETDERVGGAAHGRVALDVPASQSRPQHHRSYEGCENNTDLFFFNGLL